MEDAIIQHLSTSRSGAIQLGRTLGLSVHEIRVDTFADGEIRVTVAIPRPLVIVYASLDRPNDKLLALLFAAEALCRAGVKRLVLVAPYLCYMRQDAAFHAGEAISQKVMGQLLGGAYDRIITVDAHLHRTADIRDVFPDTEADNISAAPAIAAGLKHSGYDPATVLLGPDSESRLLVDQLATHLGSAGTVAEKERRADGTVALRLTNPALVAGRPVLLIDDIVSTGSTLAACSRRALDAGAASVDAIVVHALVPAARISDLLKAGIRSIRSTTSVPHPTNAFTLDKVLAEALRAEVCAVTEPGEPSCP